MGQDKSLLLYHGIPMLQNVANQLRPLVDELLLSTNNPENYNFLNIRTVPDRIADQGPLMALASALAASNTDLNVVTACDMPNIDTNLLQQLLDTLGDADCAIPVSEGQGFEPLCAVYRKRLVPIINDLLDSGERKVATLFSKCEITSFPIESGRLQNINTKHDYESIINEEH